MSATFTESILASSIVLAVFLLLAGVIFSIWSYLKMKRKRTYFEGVHKDLAPGQEVMFGGGIYGKVRAVRGDRVEIELRSAGTLEVSRYAIQSLGKSAA